MKLCTLIGINSQALISTHSEEFIELFLEMTSFPIFARSLFFVRVRSNLVQTCYLALQTKMQTFVEMD